MTRCAAVEFGSIRNSCSKLANRTFDTRFTISTLIYIYHFLFQSLTLYTVQCLRSDIIVLLDTLIVHVSYLLTLFALSTMRDCDNDVLDWEEADSAAERNLPDDARLQRRSTDAAEPHCPSCASTSPQDHHQVIPPVIGRTQPEEEVRLSSSNLLTLACILPCVVSQHRRRSSVNFRGARHFCPKNMHEKLTKCPNFTWFCPKKIYQNTWIFMIFAGKINKIS